MSQIIIVKGKPYSFNNTEIVLNGGEQYIFGIKDLYDEKDQNTLTWKIYKVDGGILKEKTGKGNEEFTCSIDKKLCGDYRYELEATVRQPDGTILSTQRISLGGYCTPKILSYKTNIPEVIRPGQGINADFEIEAEGLNENYLIFDLWFSDSNYLGYSTSAKCIEGKAKAKIIYLWSKLPKSDLPKFDSLKFTKSHPYPLLDVPLSDSSFSSPKFEEKSFPAVLSIKVKDASGTYIKESDNKDFVLNLNLTSELIVTNKIPLLPLPSNKTNVIVSQSEEVAMEVNGIIELEKIKVKTSFDICSDEVLGFDDYENFWILKDKGGTKCYHWLRNSNIENNDIEDIKDETTGKITKYAKLSKLNNIIPITLHSKQKFKFTASFDIILATEVNKIEIRVNRKDEKDATKYQFKEIKRTPSTGSLKKGDKLSVVFESTNKPYEDTIQYFEKFELFFEYSFGGDVWVPLRKVYFTLYLTWGEPLWNKFQDTGDPGTTMKMRCATNRNKKCILETLLFLSCNNETKGLGKSEEKREENEEKILDAIFIPFGNKIVYRAREGYYDHYNYDGKKGNLNGLGYWRDKSDALNKFPRVLRSIFFMGEVRCGEWTQFLQYLCFIHQIENFDTITIAVSDMVEDKVNFVLDNQWQKIEQIQNDKTKLEGDLRTAKTSTETANIQKEITKKEAELESMKTVRNPTVIEKAFFAFIKAVMKKQEPSKSNAVIIANAFNCASGMSVAEKDDSLFLRYEDRIADGDLTIRDQLRNKKDHKVNDFDFTFLMVKDCDFITDTSRLKTKINSLNSKAQGNDDAINVFGEHIWFRHRGTMRFYDPSYGLTFDRATSSLEGYCEKLLSGLCFTRSLKPEEVLPPGKTLINLFIRHYNRNMKNNVLLEILENVSGKGENMQVYFHTTKNDI